MSTVDAATAAAAMAELGTRWSVIENSYKNHPTETISQAAVEGILRLREGIADADAAAIPRVVLRTAPVVSEVIADRTQRLSPASTLTRTFDTKFCAAMAWLTSQFGPASLMPDTEAAERAVALRERIHVAAEPSYRLEQAIVTVTLADGRDLDFRRRLHRQRGEPDDGRAARGQADPRFEQRADAIIRAVWGIDDGRSAADVIALLHD